MSHFTSQEQTIYRSLAGRIQLGFYDDGEKFPSVQEIADRYQVSGCPAQRALKALERDGLIKLCRGQKTVILAKPYDDFLKSPVFARRAEALADLAGALRLISAPIFFQGVYSMEKADRERQSAPEADKQGRLLYQKYDQVLQALGSRTALSLYYDIGAFHESAFLDIVYEMHRGEKAERYLEGMVDAMSKTMDDCKSGRFDAGRRRFEEMGKAVYDDIKQYLEGLKTEDPGAERETFTWEPYKGRTKHCDLIAIDMLRKINQGVYPVGALLPNRTALSDTYHVSEITIRRAITLLNRLGAVKTLNGIGTTVICTGDHMTVLKIKNLKADENFKAFLEALQLLAITCGSVIPFTFLRCPQEALHEIARAASPEAGSDFIVSIIGACLQVVEVCCPLAAIREVYGKITLLLLNGSVLQLCPEYSLPLHSKKWSNAIQESLRAGDYGRFAAVFGELTRECFLIMKKQLLDIGVSGVEDVSDPAPYFSI